MLFCQALIIQHSPEAADDKGRPLGPDMIFVQITTILTAGQSLDVSSLPGHEELDGPVLLEDLDTTRWKRALIRASRETIAKASAARSGPGVC